MNLPERHGFVRRGAGQYLAITTEVDIPNSVVVPDQRPDLSPVLYLQETNGTGNRATSKNMTIWTEGQTPDPVIPPLKATNFATALIEEKYIIRNTRDDKAFWTERHAPDRSIELQS
jgi:hypothetical protein